MTEIYNFGPSGKVIPIIFLFIMSIADHIHSLTKEFPSGVRLVAVSKTQPLEKILEAYQAGQRIFGENRVQELIDKHDKVPADVEWHMIGHLQTNKVRFIVPFVSMIHGVDSLKLLKEIDKESGKINRKIPCLLQFHIAEEESKFGLSEDEAVLLLESEEYKEMKNISIQGVMGMSTFTDDHVQVRREFRQLKNYFTFLREKYFKDKPDFRELSMGMSGDYQVAIEEGSTLVRIGSFIFGYR
jgi:PLP dependent protein